ncbi:hypothetical protein OG426_19375 [Streptomyces canus]|uniref:hypothetical protein n=1 Tax=Streptomyces canus TaxID=58343 RepID=UPI00386DE11F|nr:hypothetical protein OG426_19375 [Streptomyces canus]
MTGHHAEQAPTLAVGALPAAVTDLLAAIRDALDVPLADRPADDVQRTELLTRRASDTRVVVELLLTHGDVAHSAMRLREWTAEHPVAYATWQARTEQAAAEEKQLLTEDEKGSALVRTPGGDQRCPAAHIEDPTPCSGPPTVTVLDAHNAGADGCQHHGARLLASLEGGRVYGLPHATPGTAIAVFKAAASIRPFPWVDGPRTRPEQLSRDEQRARGEQR